MGKIGLGLLAALSSIAVVILLAIVLALPMKWLWNWIMPTVFDLRSITVFQAWGIMFLSGMLFKAK
jgi:hypothetical protein